jgi:hypothetical protein
MLVLYYNISNRAAAGAGLGVRLVAFGSRDASR